MNFLKVSHSYLFIVILSFFLFMSCSTVGNLPKEQSEFISMENFLEQKGYPSFATTSPEFYYTGRDWNKKCLELIEQAKESIILSTFLGVTDVSTIDVWNALAKKAASGVKVYIIIDSSSNVQSFPKSNEFVQSAYVYLKELGVNFVDYNSLSLSNIFFLPALLDRDHRKYWVIDSSIVAIGGINVNHTSLNYPVGLGNIDIMGVMASPSLANYVTSLFIDTYNRYSPTHLSIDDFPLKDETMGDSSKTAFAIDHYWQEGMKIKDLFDVLALSTEKELWMVQGYTFLSPALIDRVKYVIDKGVKVNFILSKNATQEKYEKASFYSMVDLIESGATVYLFDSPDKAFLHQKVVVSDGRYSTFGSANYNWRSHTISRELNLMYDDEEIAASLLSFIDTLVEHSVVVDLEEAKKYRTLSYYLTSLFMQIWG
ncbi:MAG: phosphatidylserine/phosphatidylglycerophosphate/cardiolipin synthase family protein [Spirochaetia bacterium]|nr:phosphatidylserine/phosphatidylglycerophosphate/cardiolipin synthase family protein [Spirochaetia bacterium]